MPIDFNRAANFLADLRIAQREIDAIPSYSRPPDLEAAYAVQDALVERMLADYNGERLGYKIACTSDLAQQLLQVDHPIFGQTLSHSSFASPALFTEQEFRSCIIEAEFAFRMAADVPIREAVYDAESIAQFVDAILPSIEIIDHRFIDWSTVGAPSIAADNAIHGAWVYGNAVTEWQGFDLLTHEATLTVNGEQILQGTGEAVLGHPLKALAWLANELQKYGKQLKAGELITTGVCMDVYRAQSGDRVAADFGEIGMVELSVT